MMGELSEDPVSLFFLKECLQNDWLVTCDGSEKLEHGALQISPRTRSATNASEGS